MKNQQTDREAIDARTSIIERLANSVVVKLAVILILVLFLLIPMSWVNDLISERKYREQSVNAEVASKWGGSQVMSGPIIGIPYIRQYNTTITDAQGNSKTEQKTEKDYVFLAANKQDVSSSVAPEYLKRGIYQAVVYNAQVSLKGDFQELDLAKLELTPDLLLWEQAKVFIGLSDLKGLKSVPYITYADKTSSFQIRHDEVNLFENTMAADIDLSNRSTVNNFQIDLDVRGSKALTVFPTANETALKVTGDWGNPSFNGGFLPEERDVSETQFTAIWRIPSFSRKFPQQWKSDKERLYSVSHIDLADEAYDPYGRQEAVMVASHSTEISSDSDMVQVNFLVSMNNYQKTSRVAKYAVLVILLTFTSLLFTEIVKKKRVHIIQYVLIGCAMVLFYSLLLAISEHIGFNLSYLLSAFATTFLIAFFVYGITKDKKTAAIFSSILALFYFFIFFLLQLQDYALIVGTIGVFVILAVLMRVTLRIDWYSFEKKSNHLPT